MEIATPTGTLSSKAVWLRLPAFSTHSGPKDGVDSLQVVLGILYIAFGIVLVSQPLTGALLLAYVLGLALLISGVVRMLIGFGPIAAGRGGSSFCPACSACWRTHRPPRFSAHGTLGLGIAPRH
jgi:hypothetical protein